MVSMGIGVVGPSEELGDVSVALSGGLEQRSCVCSSPPGLSTTRCAHPC